MGIESNRFKGTVNQDFICSICDDVFEDPVQRPKCEHIFCKECIVMWLSQGGQYCPIDRQPLSEKVLKDAPKIFKSLLGSLEIGCDFASRGCDKYIKLDELLFHARECPFSPDANYECPQCQATFHKKDLPEHSCVTHLLAVIQRLEEKNRETQEVKEKIKELTQKLIDENQELRKKGEQQDKKIESLKKRLETTTVSAAPQQTEGEPDEEVQVPASARQEKSFESMASSTIKPLTTSYRFRPIPSERQKGAASASSSSGQKWYSQQHNWSARDYFSAANKEPKKGGGQGHAIRASPRRAQLLVDRRTQDRFDEEEEVDAGNDPDVASESSSSGLSSLPINSFPSTSYSYYNL